MCARMFPPCDFLPNPIIFPQPIPNESTISKEPNTKFHENRNVPLSTMWPSSRNPACCTAHTLQSTTASIPAQESPNKEVTEPLGDHRTSVIGGTTNRSPKTEDTTPLSALQTSTIGEPHIRRRRRKLQNHFHTTKPPSSATNGGFAEHGCCNPSARPPNVPHRRTDKPVAEHRS